MVFICPVVILGKGKETMKHSFRKLLSVLLAAVMVFGGAASTVFAFNGEDFVPEIYDIDGTDPSEAQRETLVLSTSCPGVSGSTYFQLAELGFNVGYDAATRTVLINSK